MGVLVCVCVCVCVCSVCRCVCVCVCVCVYVFAQGQEGSRVCNLHALCNALNRLVYIRVCTYVRTCMHTHIVCEIVWCCLIVCMHNVILKPYN